MSLLKRLDFGWDRDVKRHYKVGSVITIDLDRKYLGQGQVKEEQPQKHNRVLGQ